MQRMRNTFLGEIRQFLENHWLVFHEIFHEKYFSNWSIENNSTLTEGILDIPVNLQQGIIEDFSVRSL